MLHWTRQTRSLCLDTISFAFYFLFLDNWKTTIAEWGNIMLAWVLDKYKCMVRSVGYLVE